MAARLTLGRRAPPRATAPRLARLETERRRSRLAAEIAIVLAIKFALLYVIWAAFFAAPQDRDLDASGVAAALLRAPPSADNRAAR